MTQNSTTSTSRTTTVGPAPVAAAPATPAAGNGEDSPLARTGVVLVGVADPLELRREGIARALEYAEELVGTPMALAWSAADATQMAALSRRPCHVRLAAWELSGLHQTPAARPQPPTPVSASGLVVLDDTGAQDRLLAAVAAGASGYVRVDESVQVLLGTLRHAAHTPGMFTATGLAQALVAHLAARTNPGTGMLTEREATVLNLLAAGCTVGVVASRLYISASTVKNCIASLYRKLDVADRGSLIMAAVRLGLIEDQPDLAEGATGPGSARRLA